MANEPFPPGFETAIPDAIGDTVYTLSVGENKVVSYSISILDQRKNLLELKSGDLFPEPDHLNQYEKQFLNSLDNRLKKKAEDVWLVIPSPSESNPLSDGDDDPFPPHDERPVPVVIGARLYSFFFPLSSSPTSDYDIELIDQFNVSMGSKTGALNSKLNQQEKVDLIAMNNRHRAKAEISWLICR